jgi:hypothetical protein
MVGIRLHSVVSSRASLGLGVTASNGSSTNAAVHCSV